jgi:hypothetical protein
MQPTDEQIYQWKRLYGAVNVQQLEGITFYFRTLTPSEITAFNELSNSQPDKPWVHELIKRAILFPETYDLNLPGSPVSLQNIIIQTSMPLNENGIVDLDPYEDWITAEVDSNPAIALCFALANRYPALSIFELMDMPTEKLMRVAAVVQKIIGQSIFEVPEGDASQGNPEDLWKQVQAQKRRMKMAS